MSRPENQDAYRRSLEQRVAELESRLEEVQSFAKVGYWTWEIASGKVTWTEAIYRIFHLDPEHFTPQIDSILALSPWPEERARDQELIQRAMTSRERGSYEQRFLRPDGSVGYYLSTFEGVFDGEQLVEMHGTVQDITERKQAELELRRREADLRVTLESIGDAVIATDRQGQVTRMNRMAELLTGWQQPEALGQPLHEVFRIVVGDTREPALDPVSQVLQTDQVVGLANGTVLLARDGREYLIADSGAPIRADGGETVGVVLVFRDVTEEHGLQERLRQAEKMEAIGQLAGGIAHDFNNMLGGILGSAELLQPHVDGSDEARDLLSVVFRSTEQAAGLTEKLLAFSRRQPIHKSVVALHDVLHDTVEILRHTVDRRTRIVLQVEAENPVIEVDRIQLQNAFMNLGINAAQAMPEGGELCIRTTDRELDVEDAARFGGEPGPYVEVEFVDQGVGIAAENLERIFEPFFTTKGSGQGTGLGMAAVYGTVRQAGGGVKVDSEPGAGSTFALCLPRSDKTPEPGLVPDEIESGGGRILVVDDEPIARLTARQILEQLGYEVRLAADGEEALRIFAAEPEGFDLVMLDMIMPGMDGRACFEAMRMLEPEQRIVLCSGFALEDDVEAMRAAGLTASLRKPYRASTLSRVLRDVLAGR